MWSTQTPKYDGPDQPGPCQTQGDHVVQWLLAMVSALVPGTPHYDTTPHESIDDPSIGPAPPGAARVTHADQVQPLVHLLRALFGTSK